MYKIDQKVLKSYIFNKAEEKEKSRRGKSGKTAEESISGFRLKLFNSLAGEIAKHQLAAHLSSF